MADGKQWYNNPEQPARKQGANPSRPVNRQGKPSQGHAVKRPNGQQARPQARPNGQRPQQSGAGAKRPSGSKPAAGKRYVYGNRVSKNGQTSGQQRIKVNTGNNVPSEKSILPQMDITGKPVANTNQAVKPSSKRPLTAKERARAKEQQKIMAAQRRKDEARNREQAKIETVVPLGPRMATGKDREE